MSKAFLKELILFFKSAFCKSSINCFFSLKGLPAKSTFASPFSLIYLLCIQINAKGYDLICTTALTQGGFAVLKFDFTGLGASKGDFADTNFSTNVLDLLSAAEFLAENYEAPKLLVGHSLGGGCSFASS